MLNDHVTRLNTKTGETVQYLLPRSTNIRRVFVDNSTTPVTFWVGSNHGASIVKLEPLDMQRRTKKLMPRTRGMSNLRDRRR